VSLPVHQHLRSEGVLLNSAPGAREASRQAAMFWGGFADHHEAMSVPPRARRPQLQELYVKVAPAEMWALVRLTPARPSSLVVAVIHIHPGSHSSLGQTYAGGNNC
jgi:hypothetical protein